MLLEVLTGKKPTDPMFGGQLSLKTRVNQAFPRKLIDVVDERLLQDPSISCMDNFLESMFELGLLCSRDIPDERVRMRDVVVTLNKIKKDYYHSTALAGPTSFGVDEHFNVQVSST